MPSKSPEQARLMAACAHGSGYKSCPPAKVAKEFNKADKGTGIFSAMATRHKEKKDQKREGKESKAKEKSEKRNNSEGN